MASTGSKLLISIILLISLSAGAIWLFWEQLPLRLIWPYIVQTDIAVAGEVELVTFVGDSAGEQAFYVYLPGNYATGNQRYRVLYHLHGAGAAEAWVGRDCAKVAEGMEKPVNDGFIEPMIVVCPVDPTKFSMWSDSYDQQVMASTALIKDLIPYIDATYRTMPQRDGRAIQGFSMGGFGAALHGFKHHDLFNAIIIWDGALHSWQTISTNRVSIKDTMFGTEAYFEDWSPWAWAERSADVDIDLLMVVGTMPATRDFGSRYKPFLESTGREFVYYDSDCPHSIFCMTDEYGAEAFQFLADSLEK